MQRLCVAGVSMWSAWQPDRNLFFNSFFIEHPDGNLLVDPLPLSPPDAEEIDRRGGVASIVLTNRDHERDARGAAARFGVPVAAGTLDAPLFGIPIDRRLADGEKIGPARVIALEGAKSPGEIALDLPGRQAALVGDVLWGDPAGTLRLMPQEKLADPRRAVLSLRRLWALRLQHLLVGDGACIFGEADRVLGECLEARSDVAVHRVNVDELRWEEFHETSRFAGAKAEIGLLIGARKLGYRLARIDPGHAFCPLHAHALEEEMYLVWDGEPTVRTARGSYRCRRGDIVAFPTGDRGAHQLVNESDRPCTVFLLGGDDPNDVCYYPDSDKLFLRGRGGLVIRASPPLDYYDGE